MLKKIKYISIAFLFLFIIVGIVAYLTSPAKKTPGENTLISATPIPVPSGFNVDYSRLHYLTPGKSTLADVENNSGAPVSSSVFGETMTLYYKTPSSDFKNIVVLKNNIVSYIVENIFGDYRGKYSDYVGTYGQPDTTLYEQGSDFPWYIFYSKGLAIQSTANQITAFLYFIPQDQESFLKTIGKDLNLSLSPPAGPSGGEQLLPLTPAP